MPYHSINTERKVELILEHLKGARICFLARRYSVNEDSIHLWKNKVLEALPEILSPGTPGPRPRSRVQILEGKLKELQNKYELLSQLSHTTGSSKAPSLLEERTSKCPECGGARIWKKEPTRVTGERTTKNEDPLSSWS